MPELQELLAQQAYAIEVIEHLRDDIAELKGQLLSLRESQAVFPSPAQSLGRPLSAKGVVSLIAGRDAYLGSYAEGGPVAYGLYAVDADGQG